jgi:pyruvate dehydrogenase E2 component (dihydrolipoamide acetyltransferase)
MSWASTWPRVTGTGPGGVIVLGDRRGGYRTGADPTPKPEPTGSPMEEMRKAIAAAMTRSKQTIPHFYLSETIDVDPAIGSSKTATPGARRPNGFCWARFSCARRPAAAKVP